MARVGRVLVVQPAFLGDVVFTSALVDALAERFAEVDVCVTPRGRDAALAMPGAARVQVFDKRGDDAGPAGLWRAARRLRERRYDAAALPHRSPRSALLAWLARIPRRVGFDDGWPLFYSDVRPRPKTGHEVDRLLALALPAPPALTGGAMAAPRPTLVISTEDRAATEAFLGAHGVEAPFVALAPGSPLYTERVAAPAGPYTRREAALARALGAEPRPMRLAPRPEWVRAADERLRGVSSAPAALCIGSEWETKIWPAAHFATLADHLAERGLTPVLLGGPREKPLAEAVQARAGARCLDTTGNSIGEALAILARSAICVGGDSGLVHAARAMGVPTVALFGPTAPLVHELGPKERAVTLGLDCSPCSAHGQRRCPLGHHRCLRDLPAGLVLEHCEAVLA